MLDKEVYEQWSKMLQDQNPAVQMGALTQIGRAYFRPEVGQKGGENIRGAIPAKGLAKPGLPASLRDAILEKLQADDPRIRAEAILSLVHWRDEHTVNAAKKALDDPDTTVRLAAIQSAAMIKQGELVEKLISIAKSDSEEIVRAKAVDAIKWIQKEEPTGAVRTGGPAKRSFPYVLQEIRKNDSSTYVKFLAGRPAGSE